jgi:metallo-beta-lactamase family protein
MYERFPYEAERISALLLTHAHLDHVGRCPKLVKEGFSGKAYMTEPTRDLAELILGDSVGILREEARQKGIEPLYEERDVERFLSLIETVPYGKEIELGDNFSFRLQNTGHILGSASVRFKTDDASLGITSDLGNSPSLLLPDSEPITDADAIVIESVYGDRAVDDKETRIPVFRDTLKEALTKGGAVMIPAFSMERTQLMLYEIGNLMSAKEIPPVPVYLDSPLAISVTEIYKKYAKDYFKKDVQGELAKEGDLFNFPFLSMTRAREDSERISGVDGPKIIIAGAGMSHGGRIGMHQIRELPNKNATLLIVGYQAPGSPGRLLQDGAKRIRLNGKEVKVRATVKTLHGWSAHADRDGLLSYAESCLPRAKTFLCTLGEPSSARFLAQRIHDYLGVRAIVPEGNETYEIAGDKVRKIK